MVQPLVLDDNGIRPPVVAAGSNLFGGALGLIQKHVTGAIPVRRDTRRTPPISSRSRPTSPSCCAGPSSSSTWRGDAATTERLKPFKTGLLHAAAQADRNDMVVIPTAIAYDLVIEDFVLSRQGVKRTQRPFPQELAEMLRYTVGYQSRSIVTFGHPIRFDDYDPDDRRDMVRLKRRVRDEIGRLYKVVPTALVAAAIRPSIARTGSWRTESTSSSASCAPPARTWTWRPDTAGRRGGQRSRWPPAA